MKGSSLAVAGAALASTVQAQVVQWAIEKRQIPDAPLRRRSSSSTFSATLLNEVVLGGYFTSALVGTPGQNVTLQLDTGSSDVWVPAFNASICTNITSDNPGCTYGSFDSAKSSTFNDTGPGQFNITYEDNTYSVGDYFQDTFEIGGVTVNNLTMGLGLDTTIPIGLIGVGYASNEAAETIYPNLPLVLQKDGKINTVAYSLWLNDLQASTGSILFGGIDTDKYAGNLTIVDIVNDSDTPVLYDFAVTLYSLEAVSSSGSDILTSSETIVAVLDSGTTLTYLPQDMAEQTWQEVGAVYDAGSGSALVPCSLADNSGHFTFGFAGANGPRINVTMNELVVTAALMSEPALVLNSGPLAGQTLCVFGIQNQTDSPYILGDTFLRSAYVVYDLVNNQVAMAATDFNSTTSNIVAFPSDGAPIPSATAVSGGNITAPVPAPSPTSSSLSAASGFQSGTAKASAAARLPGFSSSAMVAVGLTMAFAISQSAMFSFL